MATTPQRGSTSGTQSNYPSSTGSTFQSGTSSGLSSGGTGTQSSFSRETPSKDPSHKEGPIARQIEQQTAKLPSDLFLWTALGAAGVSMVMQLSGAKHRGNFVAQWVPTLLIFGLYNKIVKVAGHDDLTGHRAQQM